MHAIIHRGLTPQSLSHAWLVVTLALTLVVAIGQLAVAHATSAAAPPVTPIVTQVSTAPVATPLGQGPIAHHDAGGCQAAADAEEREAPGDQRAPGTQTCSPEPPAAAPVAPPLALFVPDPRAGADALIALYGGAGPHGPPAAGVTQTIPPRTTLRAAPASTPAAHLFPTGPSPAITTVA